MKPAGHRPQAPGHPQAPQPPGAPRGADRLNYYGNGTSVVLRVGACCIVGDRNFKVVYVSSEVACVNW